MTARPGCGEGEHRIIVMWSRTGNSPGQQLGEEAEGGIHVPRDNEGELSLPALDGLGVLELHLNHVSVEGEEAPGEVEVGGENLPTACGHEAGEPAERDPEGEEEAAPD